LDTNDSLYHYTGSLGLLGIINDSCIRCTNLNYLNDNMEYRYAFDKVMKSYKDDFENFSNLMGDKYKKEDLDNFADTLMKPLELFFSTNRFETYAACFTSNKDEIMNWMAYGRSEVNYCIEFEKSYLEQLAINDKIPMFIDVNSTVMGENEPSFLDFFKKVTYFSNDEDLKEYSFLNFFKSSSSTSFDLDEIFSNYLEHIKKMIIWCASVKSNDWIHEREYRYIVAERYDYKNNKIGCEKQVKWRDSNGILVPYIERSIDRDKIKSITFMAKHYPERVEASLNFIRRNFNLKFEVKRSERSLVI